jgi:hypothetical protein
VSATTAEVVSYTSAPSRASSSTAKLVRMPRNIEIACIRGAQCNRGFGARATAGALSSAR